MNSLQRFNQVLDSVWEWTASNIFWFARIGFALVFLWFGILRVIDAYNAVPLSEDLLYQWVSFLTLDSARLLIGVVEILLGVLFLAPRFGVALWIVSLLLLWLVGLPLVSLEGITWKDALVPSQSGLVIVGHGLFILVALLVHLSISVVEQKGYTKRGKQYVQPRVRV